MDRAAMSGDDPRKNPREFRRSLGEFATGVTIITAAVGERRAGLTVNSFSSLSLDPPLVLWSLKRASRSAPLFREASHFAVNILAIDQIKASQDFAGEADDKFGTVEWQNGSTGAPLIDKVTAVFECRTVAAHDGGDHLLFIGEVERFERFSGKPLLFVQGAHGAATDHPALVAKDTAVSLRAGEDALDEAPFTALLSRTYHMLTLRFSEQRRAEGITENEYRVLAGLYDYGQASADELERRRFFPRPELNDALAELIKRGDVLSRDGLLTLSEQGRKRRMAIHAHATKFRAEQLGRLSTTELEAARHVLAKLLEG